MGQNGGDTGIDVGAVTDGHMTHLYAGNVGDQIALAGGTTTDLDAGFFVQTHNFLLAIL